MVMVLVVSWLATITRLVVDGVVADFLDPF